MGKDVGNFLLGAALIGASFLIPGLPGVIGAGLFATGAGFVSRSIFKPAGLGERSAALLENVVSTVGELPVVYGKAKMGLHLAELRVQPSNSKRLAFVGAVAHGGSNGAGINALNEIYVDERLAVDAGGTVQAAFKKSGVDLIKSIGKYLGTDTQAADTYLTTNFPTTWAAAHRGRGIAYLALVFEFDADIFASLPAVTVNVQGRKVYDPRDNTVKYSTNPMLCLRDYLMDTHFGLGAGRLVPYAAAAVAQAGMGSFTAANLSDGNKSTTAWSTDAAVAGATIRVDFGSALEINRCAIWVQYQEGVSPNPGTTDQNAGNYTVEYSDNDAAWSTAITGFLPRRPYANDISWGNRGAHRYWRIRLTNTPGAGAELTELEWFESEVNDAAFNAMANYCDDLIAVPPADGAYGVITAATTATPIVCTQTAHGHVNGDQVDIKQVGLTIPGLNLLGTWTVTFVNANQYSLNGSVGAGTYVASTASAGKLVTQARFTCNGVLDTANPLEENVRQLLSSARAQLVWEGGQFRPFIKQVGTAVLTLTEDDVLGPLRINLPGLDQQGNTGLATFIDPNKGDTADTLAWPPTPDGNTFLASDAGFEVDLDFELPLTNNRYTAEQIIMVGIRESRKAITVAGVFRERLLRATCGDLIALTHQTPGWTAKLFWLESIAARMDGAVEALLVEYDSAAYSLDPHNQTVTPPASSLPNPYSVIAPAGLVLTASDAELIFQPNGEAIPRIKLTGFTSTDPYLVRYEVQAKRSTESVYEDWGRPLPGDTVFWMQPVTVGETWNVQIRAVNTIGRASAWVQASILVAPITKPPPLGVVEFFDEYPGARWLDTGNGGAATVRSSPDSKFGGRVLYCTASRTGEWRSYIPYDPALMYAIKARFRCLKGTPSGLQQNIFVGFRCYDQNLQLLTKVGGGSGEDIFGVAAKFLVVTPGLGWTEAVGYLRGWNGSWYLPPASVLTNSGFNGFSAANVGDSDHLITAFHSDTAVTNSTITIDLGVGVTKAFIRAKLYLNAGSGVAQYKLQYSDNGSAWTDLTFQGGGTTWTPAAAGWNDVLWASPGAHRYWRLLLNNTPGGGPDVTEWQLLEVLGSYASGFDEQHDPAAPGQAVAGTAYVRPYFQTKGSVAQGFVNDCEWELDMLEIPPLEDAALLVTGAPTASQYLGTDGSGNRGYFALPGGGAGVNAGTATIDFGAFPGASDAKVVITGQAGILAGSKVDAWIVATATADHTADEHRLESIRVTAGEIVPGTGFTIMAVNTSEIAEPLEFIHGKLTTLAGQLGTAQGDQRPMQGGRGTRLYGLWSVAWLWA